MLTSNPASTLSLNPAGNIVQLRSHRRHHRKRRVLDQVLVRLIDGPTTEALIAEIQSDGRIWCGPTQWDGATAMRISVSSWKTGISDAVFAG